MYQEKYHWWRSQKTSATPSAVRCRHGENLKAVAIQERAAVMTMRDNLYSNRAIVKHLCRSVSTICYEITHTAVASDYHAKRVPFQCRARQIAPRWLRKLQARSILPEIVWDQLKLLWSLQK